MENKTIEFAIEAEYKSDLIRQIEKQLEKEILGDFTRNMVVIIKIVELK